MSPAVCTASAAGWSSSTPRCETLIVEPTAVCVNQSFSAPDHFILRHLAAGASSTEFVIPGLAGPVRVDGYWPADGSVPETLAVRELGVLRAVRQGVFALSDPLANAPTSPLAATAFVLGGAKQYLVTGDTDHVALGFLAGQVPIPGTLGRVDLFLADDEGKVLAVGTRPTDHSLTLFKCSDIYLCSQPVRRLSNQLVTLAYARSGRTTVLATEAADHTASVWLWTGRRLHRIPALSRYASRITTSGIPVFSLGLATAVDEPSVIRLAFDPIPGIRKLRAQPPDCLFAKARIGGWQARTCAASATQTSVVAPAGTVRAPWTTHYSVSANPAAVAWIRGRLTALVGMGDSGTLWKARTPRGTWTPLRMRS